MGPLTLATNGPVYLDTNCFIYSVERIEPYRTLLEPMWRQARDSSFEILSSEMILAETLVKPFREGDVVVETLLRSLFDAQEVTLIPATREIWEGAARLRAATGLKLPDALHAASALAAECAIFVTNDADFRRVPGLPATILTDLLREENQAQ